MYSIQKEADMGINEIEDGITKAIIAATTNVFSTMLMLDLDTGESFVKDERHVSTDLISSIHFFGEKYMGKIAIFASGSSACHISSAMVGDVNTVVSDEVKDCIGEIVNMIAGGAKVTLYDTLGDIHLLTPWIISGRHLTIASPEGGNNDCLAIDSQAQFSWIMTKFSFKHGTFLVGVQPSRTPYPFHATAEQTGEVNNLRKEVQRLREDIRILRGGSV